VLPTFFIHFSFHAAAYIENGLPLAKLGSSLESSFGFVKTGSILITVKDSGHGISAEDQKHLFKEGIQFRANQLQAGGGSGLGLWISKGVVELHRGSLTAFSEGEGKGTSFSLELPVGYLNNPEQLRKLSSVSDFEDISFRETELKDDDSCSALSSSVTSNKNPVKRAVVETILCVDDSTASRKVTVRMLKHLGYECYEAVDGANGIETFRSLTENGIVIDAILMDFEMPNMNGPDATKELKRLGCNSAIIGLTGNVLPGDRQVFFDNGAFEVLSKPLSIERLQVAFAACARSSFSRSMSQTSSRENTSSISPTTVSRGNSLAQAIEPSSEQI
jgi:CheY-like chemotaxis protein